MFDRYEKHFRDISTNISRKCSTDKSKKKKNVSEMNSGLDDANDLLRKMDLEATKAESASVKEKLLGKLKEYKSDFKNMKSEVMKYSSSFKSNSTSEEIFYDPETPAYSSSYSSASSDQGEKNPKEAENLNHSIEINKKSSNKIKAVQEQPPTPTQQLEEPLILAVYEPPAYWVDPAFISTERSNTNKCVIGIIISFVIVALVLAILYVVYFKLHN